MKEHIFKTLGGFLSILLCITLPAVSCYADAPLSIYLSKDGTSVIANNVRYNIGDDCTEYGFTVIDGGVRIYYSGDALSFYIGSDLYVSNNAAIIAENRGSIRVNNGTIYNNYSQVTCNAFQLNKNYGTIATNMGNLDYNYGTVTKNESQLFYNYGTVAENTYRIECNCSGGTVVTSSRDIVENNGTILTNQNTVYTNNGRIIENEHYVQENNAGAVIAHNGPEATVDTNNGFIFQNESENEPIAGNGLITEMTEGEYLRSIAPAFDEKAFFEEVLLRKIESTNEEIRVLSQKVASKELTGTQIVEYTEGAVPISMLLTLESCPNVTLKYSTVYEGQEYCFLIQGGKKCPLDPSYAYHGPLGFLQYYENQADKNRK